MKNKNVGKFSADKAKKNTRKLQRWKRKFNRFIHSKQFPALICIVACLASFGLGRMKQAGVDKLYYEEAIADITAGYEATILQMGDAHDEAIQALRAEYENLTPEELIKQEGEYLARMLYAYRNNSERDLRTAVWCALNRVDSAGFPDTVKEVCQQPSQWMGYSDDNPILESLYEIAIKELETWHNNYRPVNKDYVYLSWSSKEIVLRDTYAKGPNTRYWQAG